MHKKHVDFREMGTGEVGIVWYVLNLGVQNILHRLSHCKGITKTMMLANVLYFYVLSKELQSAYFQPIFH